MDPKNTRIPADRRSNNQRQLLHELLAHEDVKGLAASIAKLGLFANERLVVVPAGRRFTVLEGNRRLAAIKLLLSPELAPTTSQVKYFRSLSAKADLASFGKIDVAVVPDRLSAAPIIAALHTGDAKRRWSSLQQARFYHELIEQGLQPSEVADQLGISLAQIRSFLRTEKLHRIALSLELEADIRKRVEDPRFPLTTLERFIESQTGRKFLGIELDDEKGFVGVTHPDRFKAVLARVVSDVTTKGMTRKINDEAGFRKYIEEAEKDLPKTKKRGSFDPDALVVDNEDTEENSSETRHERPRPAPTIPKPSLSVVPRGFVCRSQVTKVSAIFKELKSLKVSEQRNSTGVMLRVLMDVALWSYIKKEGHAEAVCAHFDKTGKKRSHNPDWTPPLRDLISYAVEKRMLHGMAADGYKSARSLAAKDGNYFITIDGFNEFTHNPYVTPTEGDLRALWERAEPMLEIILN
ncbi:ParB N-terminal domain-containing protein [Billgrantia antri]|uniref:ParB/Sulfiredoxin domain-containing protein n=1 Tax=Billgrantia antri TaxID=2846777 RepID=A0ABS6ZM12_9GAMM|nr:ParB N-terminal domain-containing protein [Halomonas antri]MBW6391111.1 hypothetical protein [Halomonas antri]